VVPVVVVLVVLTVVVELDFERRVIARRVNGSGRRHARTGRHGKRANHNVLPCRDKHAKRQQRREDAKYLGPGRLGCHRSERAAG
jgi:hypothetical protein